MSANGAIASAGGYLGEKTNWPDVIQKGLNCKRNISSTRVGGDPNFLNMAMDAVVSIPPSEQKKKKIRNPTEMSNRVLECRKPVAKFSQLLCKPRWLRELFSVRIGLASDQADKPKKIVWEPRHGIIDIVALTIRGDFRDVFSLDEMKANCGGGWEDPESIGRVRGNPYPRESRETRGQSKTVIRNSANAPAATRMAGGAAPIPSTQRATAVECGLEARYARWFFAFAELRVKEGAFGVGPV
ncbi:hypothetical protein BKA70DRAFT_1532216 [Coprinopsis sp. MPI-PUGE-AT-0042]|nr:hypothetical protein BKA70DRAFT_1532216 [Coprinopsis sp. MPI-PUGE-AT-0042]